MKHWSIPIAIAGLMLASCAHSKPQFSLCPYPDSDLKAFMHLQDGTMIGTATLIRPAPDDMSSPWGFPSGVREVNGRTVVVAATVSDGKGVIQKAFQKALQIPMEEFESEKAKIMDEANPLKMAFEITFVLTNINVYLSDHLSRLKQTDDLPERLDDIVTWEKRKEGTCIAGLSSAPIPGDMEWANGYLWALSVLSE